MISEDLQSLELCNLQEITIPPRSRLYHLKPIGIGTPYVESLTGYIARLAEEHCLSTGILFLSEIASFLKEGYIFKGKEGGLDQIFANQTKALNGMGKWVINLIKALEALTLCNDLRFMTMLTWGQVLPNRNLLRSVKAWCPNCYEHWRTTNQIVYEPLLWSLNEVNICPHHYLYLCTQCPHCSKENRLLAWRSRPGYCSKCGGWLGSSSNIELVNNVKISQTELNWQTWVTSNLGDLLAATPNLYPPTQEKISQSLSTYVNVFANGNIALFAQKVGMGKVQTHRWCTGKSLPTIDALLLICFQLNISLLDCFTKGENINSISLIIKNQSLPTRKPREPHKQLYTQNEIIHILKTALSTNPPPSLVEITENLGYKKTSILYYHSSDLCKAIKARYTEYKKAEKIKKIQILLEPVIESEEYPPLSMQEVTQQLGISLPSLKKYFPEICRAISERYANYCKEKSNQRVEILTQEIRQVAFKLHSEGIEPTASRISAHLSKPGVILQKKAIAAVQAVRCELGWEK
ncbi:TniQ family protein [Nostocaceae cyanobacterium CENA369]|uniref:TniQ family protein n=1 Tax=Dendronalium phyllosphericum CENA369 TaxID=1725256 RepID=A0A8J7IGS7_9NOST|nr:TniQ family protein [Dendronalium phyllosphericum]MBH8578328.1 TniQ family protein [Dendronalium phyllosphericum CENA369]